MYKNKKQKLFIAKCISQNENCLLQINRSEKFFAQYPVCKKICTETSELSKNLQVLKESFINRGFSEKLLDTEFQHY